MTIWQQQQKATFWSENDIILSNFLELYKIKK